MMSYRILPAALLLCTLAACGESPTGTAARPAGPAYDGGGFTIGSGGAAASGEYTIDSGTVAEDGGGFGIGGGRTDSLTTTSGQTMDAGGGFTIGSGG